MELQIHGTLSEMMSEWQSLPPDQMRTLIKGWLLLSIFTAMPFALGALAWLQRWAAALHSGSLCC